MVGANATPSATLDVSRSIKLSGKGCATAADVVRMRLDTNTSRMELRHLYRW